MMNVHLLTHLAVAASMGNSHGPPQALPYAHPADLLRADQKVPKIGSFWSQASLDLKMGPDWYTHKWPLFTWDMMIKPVDLGRPYFQTKPTFRWLYR